MAYRVKEGLFDFVSRVVDNNYLKEFNKRSGLNVKNTMSLMQNMNAAEKLFFAKIVNTKRLVTFHENIYTKVTFFDSLKNLCLILESNLKWRSGRTNMLFGLISNVFSKQIWLQYFVTNKPLTCYDPNKPASDFKNKLQKIKNLEVSGRSGDHFVASCFLASTSVRNFTAHYLDEKLDILKNQKEYDDIFAREVFSILYSLSHPVK